MKISVTAAVFGLALVGLTPTPALGQPGASIPYTLGGASRFVRVCHAGCDCTALESRLTGTFDLRSLSSSPLYSQYAVEAIEWTASEPGRSVTITGHGTYRVGGTVAVERMVLDLSFDGAPALRFDSGEVSGRGDFPRITIPLRRHQEASCADSVITVAASPGILGLEPHAIGVDGLH